MLLPSAPALGPLRIASPDDILRLGIVATAGFRYSEQFTFERPYHEQYPHDTIIHYRHDVAEFVRSKDHVVLVATDRYEPDENSKTRAIIPDGNGWEPPAPGEEVVVGLAVWKLEVGSKRVGHLKNNSGSYPDLPEAQDRDKNVKRSQMIGLVAEHAEEKYFQGLSVMERIVVHPAYWNRQHGSILASWGINLAEVDQVSQGVLAASMGKALFLHVGYIYLTDIHVEGDKVSPQGLTIAVLRYFCTSHSLLA